jgi:hypothetical protein
LVNDVKRSQIFSESFSEGRVVRKNFAFMKALSPTLRRDSVLVHGLLIAFLGLLNIDPEFAIEFSEVGD